MKFDFKGNPNLQTGITDFIQYLKAVEVNQKWLYHGLSVTIDPTVDYSNENVLVRWLDENEGFNDKIILSSLHEFKTLFKPKQLC
jgi:hypothetical protein